MDTRTRFHKKVYTKLHCQNFNGSLTPKNFLENAPKEAHKKITLHDKRQNMREKCKNIFLPVLIDVFEMRQMIENYKIQLTAPFLFPMNTCVKSPHEILDQLQALQKEMLESQKWIEGVILQIDKGIQEAKEALDCLQTPKNLVPQNPPRKKNWFMQKWEKFGPACLRNRNFLP